jgi:thiol-disulfide isomerase/thioredoxin
MLLAVSGCVTERTPPPNPVDVNDTNMTGNHNNDNLEFILLDKEGTINHEDCTARGFDDKVIILESKYCGACRVAVPILREIEEELNTEFIFLDISQQDDMERMKEFRVMPQYTPTIIVGCDIMIGAKDKTVFKQAIQEFLGK